MRKTNEISIKEALELFLKEYRYEDKFYQARMQVLWEKIMGKTINRYTRKILFRNNTLTIELDSAVLKNELSYAKEKIKEIINKQFKAEIVKDVVIK